MATLTNLLQSAIITDFKNDSTLKQYPIRARDYGATKAGEDMYPNSQDQSLIITTVSVSNMGEHKPFTSIYKLIADVQIIYNGAADNFDTSATLLDNMADAVSSRMQPSNNLGVIGREQFFIAASNGVLQVYGIMADQPQRHEVSGFQRIRIISRTFIAAHVAGPAL